MWDFLSHGPRCALSSSSPYAVSVPPYLCPTLTSISVLGLIAKLKTFEKGGWLLVA